MYMENGQLVAYIQEQLHLGVSREDITTVLLAKGWQKDDIAQSFEIGGGAHLEQQPQEAPVSSSKVVPALIVGGIVILLAIGGYAAYMVFGNSSESMVTQDVSPSHTVVPFESNIAKDSLLLGIRTEKDTYTVGEAFVNAAYTLQYSGEPVKVVMLYTKSRTDISTSRPAYSASSGILAAGDFEMNSSLRSPLEAFEMDEGGFSGRAQSFTAPGTYSITIAAYACSDIAPQECGARTPTELLLQHAPRASATKTITVVGSVPSGINDTTVIETVPAVGVLPQAPTTLTKTVLACVGSTDASCSLAYVDTFRAALQSCVVSQGTVPIGLEPALGVYRGYEILGEINGSCTVRFWFLETPEMPASLLGNGMMCVYSASERTLEKVGSTENCSGSLFDAFQALKQGS